MTGSSSQRTADLRRSAFLDYLALAKPELTGLSVLTAVGAALLAGGTMRAALVTMIGTALTGAAAGALNELMERNHDGLMKRTEQRPLPAGRLRPIHAAGFGMLSGFGGIAALWVGGTAAAGLLGMLTLLTYLALYTPLKRLTPFATVIGGIPGALPPLIGWAVVQHGLTREAWALFFILFFWQMPHFLALGWMYRKDYGRAGYRLLVVVDESGKATARQSLIYAAALVPAALMPTLVGMAGVIYFSTAAVISLLFLRLAVRFHRDRTGQTARKLFFASLVVLPALFAMLVLDRIR